MTSRLSAAAAQWLAESRLPLASLDPSTDDADILPLLDKVGDARIVGIGESVHHTREFALLRHRLVRLLVERGGFDTILLEAVRPGPNPLDRFVSRASGDPEGALAATGARMWLNRQTAELLRWLAEHNRSAGGLPIRVCGIDILAPGESMRRVAAAVPLEDRDRLFALSRGFDANGLEDQVFFNGLTAADRALIETRFGRAQEKLTGARRERRSERNAMLREQVLVVLQALEALGHGERGWEASIPLRDEAMAENVLRLAAAEPGRRMILLSHNSHVAAAGDPAPLGRYLRERLGAAAYVALGTAFGEARFHPPIYGVAAAPGDLEEGIDRQIGGPEPFLLDLRGRLPPPIDGPARLQTIVPGSPAYLTFDRISAGFDLLAFVPRLGNADPLGELEYSLDVAAVDASGRTARRA